MFMSGVAKLASHDPTWRNLTALHFHYETQPLPAWTSWYMHQMPDWFERFSVLFAFGAELVAPLLLFGPRPLRLAGVAVIALLQALIAATGNYGFFNLLTLVLCLVIVDDDCYPARWRQFFEVDQADRRARTLPRCVSAPLAGAVLLLTLMPAWEGSRAHWPPALLRAREVVSGLRSFNRYGLFAVMTTTRPEIIVEGSDDGKTWLPYEFKWKTVDVRRRPAFTGLHMPRLDWQMWFAALVSYHGNTWFMNFLGRLLEGEPEVLNLLERNPLAPPPPPQEAPCFTNTNSRMPPPALRPAHGGRASQ
jgi:hypothetical protein